MVATKFRLIAMTAPLLVGPSCGLPLYLYFRENSTKTAVKAYR
ncbi:DUF2834 domain-containing protein [Psychrobacter pygoscelis]